MPQQSLYPEYPPMTAISVDVDSFPLTTHPDEVTVRVRVAVAGRPLKTRWIGSLTSLERDLLNTLVSEVVLAYMFGETTKHVVQAAARVKKQAQQHAAAHEL